MAFEYCSVPRDTTSLPRVLTGNVPMHPVNGTDDWQYRVQLPNRLAAGYYLVQVTLDDMTRSIVLEVTRLAVFTLVTETDTAAWVEACKAFRLPLSGTKTMSSATRRISSIFPLAMAG